MTTVYDDIETEARADRDRYDLADRHDNWPAMSDLATEAEDTLTCVSCGKATPAYDYCGHYAADMCKSCAVEVGCSDCVDAQRLELAEMGWGERQW